MNSQIATHLRNKLHSNAIGIFTKTNDSSIIEAAAISNIDFLILDMEHSSTSQSTIVNHIRSASLHSCPTIVRVTGVDSNEIGTALDSGATGVQVPNISTAEEAQNAVNAARFHPIGNRGVCRFVRSAQYGAMNKKLYFEESNKNLLILQVEGELGIENLDKILAVDGYDVLFIGPYDLSQSIGDPGNLESPKLLELIANVIKKSKDAGKFVGLFTDSNQMLLNYKKIGVNYMTYSVDMDILRASLDKIVEDYR